MATAGSKEALIFSMLESGRRWIGHKSVLYHLISGSKAKYRQAEEAKGLEYSEERLRFHALSSKPEPHSGVTDCN